MLFLRYLIMLHVSFLFMVNCQSPDAICNEVFSGTSDGLCMEYGFCSSCVARGCNWCSLTSRCLNADNDCGANNMYGLLNVALSECSMKYSDSNRENPKISNTEYSPKIAEIMSTYSSYAYSLSSTYNVSRTETFTLLQNSIQAFEIDVETLLLNFVCLGDTSKEFSYDESLLNKGINLVGDITTNILNLFKSEWRHKTNEIFSDATSDFGTHRVVVALDPVNEAILVSFRGTKTIPTWLSYLNFCHMNWDKSNINKLTDIYDISVDVKIMQMFSNGYDHLKEKTEFYEYVKDLISNNPSYKLFIAGHSLGGALANIFLLDLYAEYYNSDILNTLDPSKFVVYTFGQPRTGNEGFAQLINAIFDYKYYRVVYSNDPVPQLPPWIPPFNYRHNGIEIHYGSGDEINKRSGDEINKTLCQYRECTYLDPYEDQSCRKRYERNEIAEGELPEFDLEHLSEFFTGLWNLAEVAMNGAFDIFNEYISENGFDDHKGYGSLGKYGHCNSHSSAVNTIKCINDENGRDLNIDNYRCLNFFNLGITNLLMDFNNLDGCGNAGSDMKCCFGSPRGPRRICKPDTGILDIQCPLNELGDYCLFDTDCHGFLLKTAKCVAGICTDVGKLLNEECKIPIISTVIDTLDGNPDMLITKSERCSSFENDGKLKCCYGPGSSNQVNLRCEVSNKLIGSIRFCDRSPLGDSCIFDWDCSDFIPLGSVRCVDNICKDKGKNEGESCIINTDCSTINGFNDLGCCFRKCEKLEKGILGLPICPKRTIGQTCLIGTDCKHYAFGQGIQCCNFKCTEKRKNYAGLWLCPHLCRKSFFSWFGTCSETPDGACSSFSPSNNDCGEIKDGWNLGIGLGDSKYAGTDSRIMFSYCIDRECSEWYKLDNCNHNDFAGKCQYEYFIVPDLTDNINTALLQNADTEFDFEFVNCGSDGLQIDQIGIGHEAEYANIDTFITGDDKFCRFSGTDLRSFAIDGNGNCKTVSISWDGGSSTSSVIYSGLISSLDYNEICASNNNPGCAGDSNQCQVKALTSTVHPSYTSIGIIQINNKIVLIIGGLLIILVLFSMYNTWKFISNRKYKHYTSVKMESVTTDTEQDQL
eukprot:429179_1